MYGLILVKNNISTTILAYAQLVYQNL